MGAWILVAIPATVLVLFALLSLSVAAERRVLSPGALIRRATRARRVSPEFAEAFVAAQVQRLIPDSPPREKISATEV